MQMSPVYASQPYISSDQECRERFQTWAIATYVVVTLLKEVS